MSSSSRKETRTRLNCPFPGCRASLGRKADLIRHQEEKHGEMKFCSQPGCDYEGTKRSSRLKAHMERAHPELKVELHVPDADPSGSEPDTQYQVAESSTSGSTYTANPTYSGYTVSYPPNPSVSSATATSYSTTSYTASYPAYGSTQIWDSTPQGYQTEVPSTAAATYYSAPTYYTAPSDSSSYTYPSYDTSAYEQGEEEYDETQYTHPQQ